MDARPGEKLTGVQRLIGGVVDFASRHALIVLLTTLAVIAGGSLYAKKYLELRTDLLELLPRDSPGFQAFEQQLRRMGGGASLIVVVESPERAANEKLIDAISAKLAVDVQTRKACVAKCPRGPDGKGAEVSCERACGPDLISYVEDGTKEVRAFYKSNKWLFAELKDLEEADRTLDRQIAIRSGVVEDLTGDDKPARVGDAGASDAGAGDAGAADAAAGAKDEKRPTLGLDPYHDKWETAGNKNDDFPTGYFCTPNGKMHGLRIVSTTTGTGDADSEILIRRVNAIMAELNPKSFHPAMDWGLAGNIPNAQEEKDSVASDALWATIIALGLVVLGIAFYFRSFWSLSIVVLPAFLGVSAAYAFATATFGYVNTAGLFLGAIILGNGINYPIVLLGRYREFRALGMSADEARRSAVWNAFRAELVGAAVAAIAYGSLTVTRFRGFSQFGTIGFVGMLLVWLTIIPLVPALLVLIEGLERRAPWLGKIPFFGFDAASVAKDGTSGPIMRFIAGVTERRPWAFVIVSVLVSGFFAYKSINFLKDPWEYNFSRLGSKSTKVGGAGYWSTKADDVFGGKMNIAGARVLADNVEQVPALKAQILANDAKDPEGQLIEKIVTVWDMLPGTPEEQKKKLAVLESLRDHLTPAVIASVSEAEQKKLEAMRPPESLKLLTPGELPAMIQRRFAEKDGRVGTVTYIKFKDFSLSDGHTALRIAATSDNVKLPNGTTVQTASHSTIYAEMLKSMRRDGPLASLVSFGMVTLVVLLSTRSKRGAFVVLLSLLMGVACMIGGAAITDGRLHYVNFIALPITFGIGCEYPFNVFDRTRILKGDVSQAVRRTGGAVALCSYTTVVGYSSLIFNDFQALQSFGVLAMAGEIACIFGALFVVPSLLHILLKGRALRAEADHP